MKPSIRTRIVFITVSIVFFAIGANTLTNCYVFMGEYSNMLQSKTVVVGQSLRLQLDRLMALGIPLENLIGFEEQCQEIVESYEDISYAMVVDSEGRILFHNDALQQGKTSTEVETLNAVKSAKTTINVVLIEGTEYYDVVIPVFNAQKKQIGAVRIGSPTELIIQRTEAVAVHSIGVAVISFILAISLLVPTLSFWVTKPVWRLLAAIQRISAGGVDLRADVGIHSGDEIGQLASAFDKMTEDLKKSREELEEYTKDLEKKISERTEELSVKMAEIEEFNKMLIGRELRMVGLKKEINVLLSRLGEKPRYEVYTNDRGVSEAK